MNFGWPGRVAIREGFVISRRAASEFPNDNPELHDGLVWTCPEPRGRALPTLRFRPSSGELPKVLRPSWDSTGTDIDAEPSVGSVVEGPSAPEEPITTDAWTAAEEPTAADELSAEELTVVEEPSVADPSPLAVPPGPFEVFTAKVAHVALGRGATRAAGAITALLTLGCLATQGLDPVLRESLVDQRIISATGHVTAEFAASTRAWRSVLEGTEADLSACGSTTLDSWAAELLAAVTNASRSEAAELRRELRRAGIAAFGLLAVA